MRERMPGLAVAASAALVAWLAHLALPAVPILTTVAVVVITFAGTIGLGRAMGLPGHQPVLVASGFSICGASAIGTACSSSFARTVAAIAPIALVTLCGTLAIAVLPALWHPLGLSATGFGHWVGATARAARRSRACRTG